MSTRSEPEHVASQLASHAGAVIRDRRSQRGWTLRDLGSRAHLSASMVQWTESGRPASLLSYARLATALDLRPTFELLDPRKRANAARSEDPVHAAMGELEARRLVAQGRTTSLDEPFQHYQFAGRADVIAFDLSGRALLHVENRTRFPNIQDAFGSYNAKRQYLPAALAQRVGLRGGWDVVTNAIVAVWSAEVLHSLRIRHASFRSICPSPPDDFLAWWNGDLPKSASPTSTLLVLDPQEGLGRRSRFAGLEAALRARPRYRGYADVLAVLTSAGQA